MNTKKVNVLSHVLFNELCNNNNWSDDNVESLTDSAFISVVCTEDVVKYYNGEISGEHWFKKNHPNVLNIEFDDVLYDIIVNDTEAKALSQEQAQEIVDFIERNKGKDFYIHCTAGISRSGAIGTFIAENYDEYKGSLDKYNSYLKPNGDVLCKLNSILWNKHFDNLNLED